MGEEDELEVSLTLKRASVPPTSDELLWEVIKDRTQAVTFARYVRFYETAPAPEQAAARGRCVLVAAACLVAGSFLGVALRSG